MVVCVLIIMKIMKILILKLVLNFIFITILLSFNFISSYTFLRLILTLILSTVINIWKNKDVFNLSSIQFLNGNTINQEETPVTLDLVETQEDTNDIESETLSRDATDHSSDISEEEFLYNIEDISDNQNPIDLDLDVIDNQNPIDFDLDVIDLPFVLEESFDHTEREIWIEEISISYAAEFQAFEISQEDLRAQIEEIPTNELATTSFDDILSAVLSGL